jgi:hypothetical protein
MPKISRRGVTVAVACRDRNALDRRCDGHEAAGSGQGDADLERLARLLRVGCPAPSGTFVRAFERSLLQTSRLAPSRQGLHISVVNQSTASPGSGSKGTRR